MASFFDVMSVIKKPTNFIPVMENTTLAFNFPTNRDVKYSSNTTSFLMLSRNDNRAVTRSNFTHQPALRSPYTVYFTALDNMIQLE